MALENVDPATGRFSVSAVSVTDAANYVELARLPVRVRVGNAPSTGDAFIVGTVGAGGALAALKLTAAETPGGTHRDLIEGTVFNAGYELCPDASLNPHTTAAGGAFWLRLSRLRGVAEIGLWAKKATGDTTVALAGNVR